MKGKGKFGVVGQPEKSLGSGDLAPEQVIFRTVDKFVKLVRFKGSPGFIDKGRNVVFDSLRNVFDFLFFQDPFLVILGFF